MNRIERIKINDEEYRIEGKSAYEVAVAAGFEGTEEEWLYSLAEQANGIAKSYADLAEESEKNAKQSATDAENARKEAEAHTSREIHKWLDEHPEATTTVQDGALTEEKFSDGLKLKAIKDYVTPEVYGAKGDGVTDDSNAFQRMLNECKSTGKIIYLKGSYYLGKSVMVPNDSVYTIVGRHIPHGYLYAENAEIFIDKEHDAFVGENHSLNKQTKTSWNVTGVKFATKESGSMATVFKDIMFIGSTFTDCIAERIFAFLEGGFDFISSLVRFKTINIRNFFMSDYVFKTPTYMNDIRRLRYETTGGMTFDEFKNLVYCTNTGEPRTYTNGDNQNLFEGCYFNGHNPASAISTKDLPCFYLTHYCDYENYGNNCFLDYWYAIEECLRTNGSRNPIRWRDTIFQNSVYFFANNNADTANANTLVNFMLDGCQLFNFGGYNERLSDREKYADSMLTSEPVFFRNAIITNNVVSDRLDEVGNMRFEIRPSVGASVFSQGNMCLRKDDNNTQVGTSHCMIVKSTKSMDYQQGVIENSYIQELDMQTYEVAEVPTSIKRNNYTNVPYDWLFVGRKFIFKTTGDDGVVQYSLRTLIPTEDGITFIFCGK